MPDFRTPAAKKANYTGGRPKDESKLSTDPKQVRVRLRRAQKGKQKHDGRIDRDIEFLYQKPIAEWDLEELAHGKPRDVDGTFRGRKPSWITSAVTAEAKRRLLDETFAGMAGHVDLAIKTVKHIMTDTEVDEKGKPLTDSPTKLKAAAFVIEHIIGKPKAIIELDASDGMKSALAAAIVMDDGTPQDEPIILEGEWEEDEEDDGSEV